MQNRIGRWLVAAFVPIIAVGLARLYDIQVLIPAQHAATTAATSGPVYFDILFAPVITALGAIAIVATARWSRSLIVGLVYLVIGGIAVLIPTLAFQFAMTVNGAAPVLPDRIAQFVVDALHSLWADTTGSVPVLVAAVFVGGPVALVAAVIERRRPVEEEEEWDDEAEDEPDDEGNESEDEGDEAATKGAEAGTPVVKAGDGPESGGDDAAAPADTTGAATEPNAPDVPIPPTSPQSAEPPVWREPS